LDLTPHANIEQWSFTPLLLDPNSSTCSSFPNQLPDYYHPQAEDLRTPGIMMGLETPLSMQHSEGSLPTCPASTGSKHSFNPQAMALHVFQNPNPFAFYHHQQHPRQHQQQQRQEHPTFSPHQFNHDPAQFGFFQRHHPDGSKMNGYGDVEMHEQSSVGPLSQSLEIQTRHKVNLFPIEQYVFSHEALVDAVALARSDIETAFGTI
jgi:hypothetical protein